MATFLRIYLPHDKATQTRQETLEEFQKQTQNSHKQAERYKTLSLSFLSFPTPLSSYIFFLFRSLG